jgi:NifB/MoaA-like Fe-S oxidoreductase
MMAQPVIEQFAEDIRQTAQLEVQVLPIVNKFFGAEVTVAGLLCGQDVLEALETLEADGNPGDLVLLPRVMLDNEGTRFLDDVTVEDFKARLPVRAEFVRNAQETVDAIRLLASSEAPSATPKVAARIQAR